MLKIIPPDYKYCPFCGGELSLREEEKTERKFCPKCKWTYYPTVTQSAGGVAIRNEKVLLVKRNREPYKGTWMYPAGFLQYGEHPDEALVREFKEETGYEVSKFKLTDVLQSEDDYREPGHLTFNYLVEIKGKSKNGDHEENSEMKWFDLNHLPEIGWKIQKEVLNKIINSWESVF